MQVGMCLYYEVQAAKLTLTRGQIGSDGSGCSRVALALAHCCDSVERERFARCSEKIKRPTQDLPSLSKDSPNTGPSTFFLSQGLKSTQPCIIIMARFLATLLKMESSRPDLQCYQAAMVLFHCSRWKVVSWREIQRKDRKARMDCKILQAWPFRFDKLPEVGQTCDHPEQRYGCYDMPGQQVQYRSR